MKRTILIIVFSFLLAFAASFRLARPAYAAAMLGAEGMHVMTVNDSWIGFVINMMGLCDDGTSTSTTAPADIGAYFSQTIDDFKSQYITGECPTALQYKHSALASLSGTVYSIYSNPPATTQEFAMDLGQTLGFIPHRVEAQGIGFSGLSVLLPIWKAFRNVAYALLSVILIVIGFMVMFRKKIDPKTVVTVQNAIPRVVVALLLVTFSYAIVGLMIDLMYVVIVLAANLIVQAAGGASFSGIITGFHFVWNPVILDPKTWFNVQRVDNPADTTRITDLLLNGGMVGTLRFFFGSGLQSINDIGRLLTGNWNPYIKTGAAIIYGAIMFLVGGGATNVVKGGLVAGLSSGPVLLAVLVIIVLVFGIVRLVFMLVDAYLSIIISVLFSPFQLMLEAIPGTNAFSSWFRWLLANIIVFPLTAVLLLIAAFLTAQGNAIKLWAPPLLSGGQGVSGMSGFIGLGMLLVIPNIVGSIKKALKAEPFIPGGVGAVVGPLGAGVGQLFQLGYQFSFISSAIRHKPDDRPPMQTIRDASQKGFGAITGQGEGH